MFKKMKRMKFIMIVSLVLFSNTLFAQTNKQLKLYAVLGSQINCFKTNFNTSLNGNLNSFSMGAGSSYYFGDLFLGTEFYYSNDNVFNQDYKLDFSGMNSKFSIGYDILKSDKFQLEPQIGFLMSNNKILKDDILTNKTAYFTHNNIGITPSVSFNFKNQSGQIFGIKAGYNYSFNQDGYWKNGIDNNNSTFLANTNSVFVQLNIGGIINIKKKDKLIFPKLINIKSDTIMNSTIIDNKGVKLFSTIYKNPNNETIILLHGGPGVPMDFAEVINVLKDSYQIITFQQRGTKQSPCPTGNFSIEAYISDIDCIAQYYGVTQFHLWGHSWGGLYAQIYAEKYPEKLLSLFLCSSGSGTNIEWKQTEKEVMQFNKSKCGKGEWSKMALNSLLGIIGSDNAYKRLFNQVIKNYNNGFEFSTAINFDFENIKAEPINKTRRKILKYPLLTRQENPSYYISVVYGEKDIYQSSKEFVINRFPTAKIFILQNSGHLPWQHNPAEFYQILKIHYP